MRVSVIFFILLSILSCSVRPDETKVKEMFTAKNVGVDQVQVKIDEDEVVARTFVITYRVQRTGKKYKQMWMFMDQGKDSWTEYPAEEL